MKEIKRTTFARRETLAIIDSERVSSVAGP
jgi:hypothetical protein